MQKRDFETYQKRFRDFEILPKFSSSQVDNKEAVWLIIFIHNISFMTKAEVTLQVSLKYLLAALN